MRYMHWMHWEQAIATKLIRYPRSTTPRERTMTLLAIRMAVLGGALLMLGYAVLALGGIVGWYPPLTVTGVVLFTAGLALLVLSIAVGVCLIIMYGD
jgi:hypothetical protein